MIWAVVVPAANVTVPEAAVKSPPADAVPATVDQATVVAMQAKHQIPAKGVVVPVNIDSAAVIDAPASVF